MKRKGVELRFAQRRPPIGPIRFVLHLARQLQGTTARIEVWGAVQANSTLGVSGVLPLQPSSAV